MFKVIVFCALVAVAHGGIARLASLGIVESSPTVRVESIPSITKIEELGSSFSSHVRSELINAPTIAKIEHIASPLTYKTELVAAPSVAKVEHVIPSAQSLFKGELISAPTVRYETALPAATIASPSVRLASLPAISNVEHLSSAFVTSPSLKYEVVSPSFARYEHFAPTVTALKTDFVSAPIAKSFLSNGFVL